MDEELATEWIQKLSANADTLCFEAVGVSVDNLKGVEWLNGVRRLARDGCVVADMQYEDVVRSIKKLMDNTEYLWLQVDVSGGGWAPCDAPVVVDDGYVAAGALGGVVANVGGAVAPPPAPQVVLTIRGVAGELGLPWDEDCDRSDSNMDMGSSLLADRAGGGRRGRGGGVPGMLALWWNLWCSSRRFQFWG